MVRQSLISGLLVLALVLPAACAAPPAATGESAGSTESAARARALLLLDSDNPGSRREGYAVLGAVGIDDDLPRLYTALYDADPVVRAIAENAIWHIWGRSGDAEIDRRFSIALEQMETIRDDAFREIARVASRHVLMIEPFFDLNDKGPRGRYIAARDYLRARIGDLSRYGLQVEWATADFPQKAVMAATCVLAAKR